MKCACQAASDVDVVELDDQEELIMERTIKDASRAW